MGSLLRSEKMLLCQLFIQKDAAYNCVGRLGHLSTVQFRDLNPDINAFRRNFVHEVRRFDEMQRMLEYIHEEIQIEEITVKELKVDATVPNSKEMITLENRLIKLEKDLREEISNYHLLQNSYCELIDFLNVLNKNKEFFDPASSRRESIVPRRFSRRFSYFPVVNEARNRANSEAFVNETSVFGDLEFMTGVIARDKFNAFEVMLWRISRGNLFVRAEEFDTNEPFEVPIDEEQARNKFVFVILFHGENLKERVEKICEGFRAKLFPCPERQRKREEMVMDTMIRLKEMRLVMDQTKDHKHRVLQTAAEEIRGWMSQVQKVKAIYCTMNMFSLNVTHEAFLAECWCPENSLKEVQAVLDQATTESGSPVPTIIETLETPESPPTFNRTDKYTEGFQSIVDAYGCPEYQEINPAPFAIITFPFVFAVMFGDAGHGLLMLLFALCLVWHEKSLQAVAANSEIFGTFFGGRYIILLMGLFSIYTGIIYNDIFAKSVNLFGSSWRAANQSEFSGKDFHLNPHRSYSNSPYPLGIDPIWATSHNKILFINSYKMKLSVILGVFQMLFGIILSLLNHLHFKKWLNIFCEFIPQILFLLSIFGYMNSLIITKWWIFTSEESPCAPSILITLINMFMMKYPKEPCSLRPMFKGQETLQMFLVLLALICVPWMLVLKPAIIRRQMVRSGGYKVTFRSENGTEDASLEIENEKSADKVHDKEKFGDVVIHQAIHTIEFCLGSISHTASYLRLWALSLAHAQLSEVLWNMVLRIGLLAHGTPIVSGLIMAVTFGFWATLTLTILLVMEGLSAYLHALRLHWVEWQSKFYSGTGYPFTPFSFNSLKSLGE